MMTMPLLSRNLPLISVIVVNFNGGLLLTTTVEAVLSSTVPVEVLVLDNGSTDASLQQLQQRYGADARLHIIRNYRNRGFAQASNIGLRQARGEYLLLLNPDAVLQQDTLARMVAALRANPDAGMAGCRVLNPDGTEQMTGRRRVPTPARSLVELLSLPDWLQQKLKLKGVNVSRTAMPASPEEAEAISGSFMLVRRAALQDVGLLDEGYFLHCEDLDWCMRFWQRGWRILFIPNASVIHHKGYCSKNRPVRVEWHKHCGMVRFHNKFFRKQYPVVVTLAVWTGIWLHFAWAIAYLELRNGVQRIRSALA